MLIMCDGSLMTEYFGSHGNSKVVGYDWRHPDDIPIVDLREHQSVSHTIDTAETDMFSLIINSRVVLVFDDADRTLCVAQEQLKMD